MKKGELIQTLAYCNVPEGQRLVEGDSYTAITEKSGALYFAKHLFAPAFAQCLEYVDPNELVRKEHVADLRKQVNLMFDKKVNEDYSGHPPGLNITEQTKQRLREKYEEEREQYLQCLDTLERDLRM